MASGNERFTRPGGKSTLGGALALSFRNMAEMPDCKCTPQPPGKIANQLVDPTFATIRRAQRRQARMLPP
jgi:hypothetical protein